MLKYFIKLPRPLKINIREEVLYQKDKRPGIISGKIIALECYPGEEITACWVSDNGGMVHDLTLDSFIDGINLGLEHEDAAEYVRVNPLEKYTYSVAGKGQAIIEEEFLNKRVSIFSKLKKKIGIGKPLYILHWPEDNLLLHLIEFRGQLILWPPHKIMWNVSVENLPDWKKIKK